MITEPKKRDVVLVVDDSPETLRLLTDALDGAGMTVMVALDGAAAHAHRRPDHARHHPARRGDARHGRLRDLPAAEARRGPEQRPGHLHDRPGRDRAHRARAGSRRRRLRHQADRDRGDAGAHPRASRQCAADAERARRARRLRPLPARRQSPGQDHVGDAAGAEAAGRQSERRQRRRPGAAGAAAAMAGAGAEGKERIESAGRVSFPDHPAAAAALHGQRRPERIPAAARQGCRRTICRRNSPASSA